MITLDYPISYKFFINRNLHLGISLGIRKKYIFIKRTKSYQELAPFKLGIKIIK